MAKPKHISFSEVFEPVLCSAWNRYATRIEGSLLAQTREAIAHVRRVYWFKEESPSKLQFNRPRNQVGYLGSFGQRHAYLGYYNLEMINERKPLLVPQPTSPKGELTITSVGAGAAVEVYGFLRWYNKETQRVRNLRVNCVERISEWEPTRNVVFSQWFKREFPKVNIFPKNITADLTNPASITKFAENHDALISTDILLIYNVLNEIETKHANMVWRNLNYILRQAEKPVLVLLMEPAAPKISPRINWIKQLLVQCSTPIIDETRMTIDFNVPPMEIVMDVGDGELNKRLFSRPGPGADVEFQTSLERQVFASVIEPRNTLSKEQVYKQLATFQLRRSGRSGRFTTTTDEKQLTIFPQEQPKKIRLTNPQVIDISTTTPPPPPPDPSSPPSAVPPA